MKNLLNLFSKNSNENRPKFSFLAIKLIIYGITIFVSIILILFIFPIVASINKILAWLVSIIIILFLTTVISQMLINLIITQIKKKNF